MTYFPICLVGRCQPKDSVTIWIGSTTGKAVWRAAKLLALIIRARDSECCGTEASDGAKRQRPHLLATREHSLSRIPPALPHRACPLWHLPHPGENIRIRRALGVRGVCPDPSMLSGQNSVRNQDSHCGCGARRRYAHSSGKALSRDGTAGNQLNYVFESMHRRMRCSQLERSE